MAAYLALEQEIASWAGYSPEQVVVCSSGTAALHLALEALRLPPGSEVITGDFNMVAVPRAIKLAGFTPVFVDCDDKLLMRTDLVNSWYKSRSIIAEGGGFGIGHNYKTVILAVHIYGRRVDMNKLAEIAGPAWFEETYLVEDLAEAHGVKPHERTDAACWSFYKNKIIAGEEGGAIAFRDVKHAELARRLRTLGFTPEHDFSHVPRGHNYRLANCLAEIIRRRLSYVGTPMTTAGFPKGLTPLEQRRLREKQYEENCPEEWRMPKREAPWVYDFRIPGLHPDKQTEIVKALQAEGIAARHAFKPMQLQTEFRNCRAIGGENALQASREVIYLPLGPETPPNISERAFATIKRVLGGFLGAYATAT